MIGGKKSARMQVVGYGLILALGAFALDWLEYRYLARSNSTEVVIFLIAVGFLILGVWIGGWLAPQKAKTGFKKNTAAQVALGITAREFAVLELLARGQSNKEMARQLGVSPNTIKSHLSGLFFKLEVQRRTQAIARARLLEIIN